MAKRKIELGDIVVKVTGLDDLGRHGFVAAIHDTGFVTVKDAYKQEFIVHRQDLKHYPK